ncbi:DHH family phosphoesterase [Caproiciproducens galactitolivorans]|uniref:Cyclic-di-AMP phosphodiesterase n=1 Tax=Caproiciproducens galactitolivorans TaxID=642589 RepID=A0A4Z0YGQ7_9FIRM|nr:DHH family phosphoesterase [Caproiciproducens galactitolivorans]QEY34314.1 DHH family phosphoesterase [Caproiciproducens galactitolivorans]TGJ77923.1 bifunctional oligoribonuclease and PAP phosphatase NrnA [Caproiciproducens galactitolivorans]
MKRRVWVSSPVFFVITAVMLIMACISYFYNPILSYAEMALAVCSVVAVILLTEQFKAHVATAVKSAQKILSGDEYRALMDFTMPVAVVGEAGDIIWVNSAFTAKVGGKHECRGENILKFIYPKTVNQIMGNSGTDITVGDRDFTVFAAKTEYGSILYFIDDTYYKEINREYIEQRPVVMIACFDNREELARDSSGSEDTRIASEVESALINWAQNMNGFFKKLSGARYLILADEAHLREAMGKRFEILDTIRGIKAGERRSATISIGVGRGADSLMEAEEWARKALDMALGRGGDQVAVKQKDDTYEFFGGLSKGVEKRDKVRTRVIAATLSDHIKNSDNVLIMGHKYSDLDSVGAAVGLWSAVTKSLKKPAFVVLNRSQTLASPLVASMDATGQDVFRSPMDAMALVNPKTMLIVVDTHSQDFVESAELLNAIPRVVVIDHHRMMVKHVENALVFYHEPYASSTSEMVAELVQYIGDNTLGQTEAEGLLSGIMLDTKNFVLKTGVRTFEAAAYLRRRGADTVEVKRMFSDTIDTYKAKYQIVSGAEILNECAIASADREFPDIRITSAQAADELLSIQGVNASFVLFPTGNVVNVSARSLGEINVQLIMEALGGGGHLTMAGAQLSGMTVQQAREKLISVIQDTMAKAVQ